MTAIVRFAIFVLPAAAVDINVESTCPLITSWPPSQMQDNTNCHNIGIHGLASFRHGIELFDTSSDPAGFIPYFSSQPLTGDVDTSITNAVVWVHGLGGNANAFFCDGMGAAVAAGAGTNTVTITPWFGSEKATAAAWFPASSSEMPEEKHSTCWKGSAWLSGGNSYNPHHIPTSFEALDRIVSMARNTAKFPNLQQVTVAGFSAGCQMTTRWSFFSAVPMSAGVPVRVIAGDCGTYMYFDETRPHESCSPLTDTGEQHMCFSFEIPNAQKRENCPNFDTYKYGLNLTSLGGSNSYVQTFADDLGRLQEAIADFPSKDVRLLLGNLDMCQCNVEGQQNPSECFASGQSCLPSLFPGCCDTYPDSTHNVNSYTCGGLLGGSNRLQRGLNWVSYLEHFYARRGVRLTMPKQTYFGGHDSVSEFAGAHDDTAWGHSPAFARWAGWTAAVEEPDESVVV